MPSNEPRKRVLILVVAFDADETLRPALDRIPPLLFADYDCELLIVDDASTDRTFAIGNEYRLGRPDLKITVLRNEYNQGYGGNQKVGLSYALAEGHDFIVVLHGNGKYAPEELPRLIAPLCDDRADAVFGSRTMERFKAVRQGMPLFKYVGNRILTAIQNRLLGMQLSEYHSGYRAYRVATLGRLPYRLNSNGFPFDTEITIQLINAGARIAELPIPVYDGSEIGLMNGFKYAHDVLAATLQNVAHRADILFQRRYDCAPETDPYDLKLGYPSSHTWAIAAVPAGSKVLDLGAGSGGIAVELARKGCAVTAIDRHPALRPSPGVTVHTQDLDDEPRYPVREHQYLLALDIIEHLRDPDAFLSRLRAQFDYGERRLILTTPNVAFIIQRLMLLIGQFNYGKRGILDRTHTRLYSRRSIRRLLVDNGFLIRSEKGVPAPFPKVLGDGRLGRFATKTNLALIRLSKTLFAYQFLIEADATPDVDFILRAAKERGEQPEAVVRVLRARP